MAMVRKEIPIQEVGNIHIGQTEDREAATGCTVLISEEGMCAGLDVRGGGPASRDTHLLDPQTAAQTIHAVLLGGGSAFGLGAASGVMQYLEEHDIGFDVGVTKVPLVAQSDLFDLTVGRSDVRPQPEMGYENGFCRPECTRCSEVCPAGAIEKISREEKTQYHIGTAHVDLQACISATGKTHCGKCASKCPVGAIHMVERDGFRAPAVNEEVCIGCGACEQYCPVRPISAITVNGKYQHV